MSEGGRRRLLARLATGTGVAAAGAAVWPLAAAVVDPLGAAAEEAPWVDVAGERELGGKPLKAVLRAPVKDGFFTQLLDLGSVYLLPGPPLIALSSVCPHLGCGITQDARGFACPCHDSRFDPAGARASGPSPRSMDPLPVRVTRGRVEVQALRFATGTRERKPA